MSEDATRAMFEVLARLIRILAARGIIEKQDVLELVKIAKRRGRV